MSWLRPFPILGGYLIPPWFDFFPPFSEANFYNLSYLQQGVAISDLTQPNLKTQNLGCALLKKKM